MTTFKKGQVWREYSGTDYGDIIRWQVIAVGKPDAVVRAVVQNCATLKELSVTADAVDTFTFQCELTAEPPRLAGAPCT